MTCPDVVPLGGRETANFIITNKKAPQALHRTKVVGKRFAKNRAKRPFFAISAAVPLGGRGGVMPYKSFSSVKRKA